MLQITNRAAAMLVEERTDRGVPDSFGLRVHQDHSDSATRLRLEFTDEPLPGDEVSIVEGIRMFVAPDVAEVLAEQTIDAPDGTGLVVRDQSEVADD